jgi:trigger factor
MNSTVKKINGNQAELTVELGKEELDSYVKKTEELIGKELEIDGFRKGKVPPEQVRKHVDSKKILEEAMELSLKDSMDKAVKEQGYDVITVTDLKIKENTPVKLLYTVVLTLFPDVKLSDLNFHIAKHPIKVEEKEILAALEEIRASRAVLTDKDGFAEKGDKVEIDFEVKSEGKIIEGGVSKNHPLVLGNNTFIPGFEDQLIGMIKDEAKEFSLNAPKDYFHKEIAGKKLDFNVKMVDIKKVKMPELTDEFVKSLGSFENMEKLKESIRTGITEEKKLKERQKERIEILETIISKSDINVPEPMIEQQLQGMISDFDGELHANGMELSMYLAHLNKTQDDLKKEWRANAEKQVKIALILHKLAKEKNLTVTDEELKVPMNEAIQAMVLRGQIKEGGLEVERVKADISNRLLNEKVLTLLEETCLK